MFFFENNSGWGCLLIPVKRLSFDYLLAFATFLTLLKLSPLTTPITLLWSDLGEILSSKGGSQHGAHGACTEVLTSMKPTLRNYDQFF